MNDPHLRALQCSSPVPAATWDLLNKSFFARRPEVELRVYGSYRERCDLSFVSRMTNVIHFAADRLMDAESVERIADMRGLKSLSLGIYGLRSFDVLYHVDPGITRLSLGPTKSRSPDLKPLSRFRALEELHLERQQKHIEVLSELTALKEVTLRSISTPGLGFLTRLREMWSLDIKLGGITDLSAIRGMRGIRYLELWQVRGLSDIGVIADLLGLQYLFLQSLCRVTRIPCLGGLRNLRRVYLESMKGLTDLTPLQHAPALEEFILVQGGNLQPEDVCPVLRNRSLRRAACGFGSTKRNERFAELRQEHGIEEYRPTEFVYR